MFLWDRVATLLVTVAVAISPVTLPACQDTGTGPWLDDAAGGTGAMANDVDPAHANPPDAEPANETPAPAATPDDDPPAPVTEPTREPAPPAETNEPAPPAETNEPAPPAETNEPAPAAAAARPDGSGWSDLFAADLSNAVYPEGIWTVDDGVLTASEDQAIWTQKDYNNFTLDLEFKTAEGTNSGVIVYCSDRDNWIPNL